ncbi:hypothetical protein ACK3SF_01260 [Candidatus Nanosalina sp. VS9-1]|uniref:hypothetical protein n=1 Tax=Candidatus Nanosalina sp. VS9-1 TaxID=3388566 RepID=UPI0039E05677
MVDEVSSPSKGWQEVNALMQKGGLSDIEEVIMFNKAQSGDASYEEATAQTQLSDYQASEYTTL